MYRALTVAFRCYQRDHSVTYVWRAIVSLVCHSCVDTLRLYDALRPYGEDTPRPEGRCRGTRRPDDICLDTLRPEEICLDILRL